MRILQRTVVLFVVCIWRHQKHDNANDDQFAPNFDIACKTIQRVPVPNLKLFGPNKAQSYGPKKLEDFLLCNMGNGILLPTIMAATI